MNSLGVVLAGVESVRGTITTSHPDDSGDGLGSSVAAIEGVGLGISLPVTDLFDPSEKEHLPGAAASKGTSDSSQAKTQTDRMEETLSPKSRSPLSSSPLGAWEKPFFDTLPHASSAPVLRESDPANVFLSEDWPTLGFTLLSPELVRQSPWAAKMNPQSRNLHKTTTPAYLDDGTPKIQVPNHVLLHGLENQKEYIIETLARRLDSRHQSSYQTVQSGPFYCLIRDSGDD